MATYLELQTRVNTLVIDTPAAVQALVPVFIKQAIKKLQTKHNFKIMEASVSYTTVALNRTLDVVPADWKESRGKPFFIEDSGSFTELHYVSSRSTALAAYGDEPDFDYGEPKLLFETADEQFEVFPYPDGLSDYSDGEYRITIPYWKFLPELAADADSNWFTNNAEEYIVYRALAFAFYANEDEKRGDHWMNLALSEYRDVLLTDKRRRLTDTDTLVFHTGARMPHTQE